MTNVYLNDIPEPEDIMRIHSVFRRFQIFSVVFRLQSEVVLLLP